MATYFFIMEKLRKRVKLDKGVDPLMLYLLCIYIYNKASFW